MDEPLALTGREVLAGLRALNRGDFAARLPDDMSGVSGKLCMAFNELAARHETLERDLSELRTAVGREGRLKRRLYSRGVTGGWNRYANSVNELLDDLVEHTDEMFRVVSAVGVGDLTVEVDEFGVDAPLQGDFLRHVRVINNATRQLKHFGAEVTRVAREVGLEGKLGAQATVPGASGAYREIIDSVNLMAANLTTQVREIGRVTTAVAQGDLSQTIDIEARGEVHTLKQTINTMVGQLSSFAEEVARVAREVGTEGILGGQAHVRGVSGVWRELTENVNSMANNLTQQVRNVAEVATAIAAGDLSKKITVDANGEILELKNTINTMVDQLSSFADEVTRVSREVGTEGKLGGQAEVTGVSGRWRELTENVNGMAKNLTDQVRNISEVTSAIAAGDLGRKITVDAKGEILQLKSTINATVDKLNHFSAEVSRVARLVGTEGVLGVQANVRDVSGVWKELTENVNGMAKNLTDQVRNISQVTTAVAHGDLSKKITVSVQGELLELKNTINDMVEQLSAMALEVTRVAREVGTEGKLGGQAAVPGVRGTWKELTDNVNSMASNLTDQVRDIAGVATAIADGDLTSKITVEVRGELLELKNTINTMVDQLSIFARQVTRVAREVGVEGRLGGQAEVPGGRGMWKELTDHVNLMAANLSRQVRDIAAVTTAVAMGDLSKTIEVEVRGEMLELKGTINTMVGQLRAFADEVTRVAREVGTEGVLGGQAQVSGLSGTWRELTDNVNVMALNLTDQVRGIARVVTAVANGNLREQLQLSARGEIATLVQTINDMIVTLSTFADQVSNVAHDVGVEGTLGGQADVPGAAGIWSDLTSNVNELAGNLTRQVRAIGDVATAVTNGDLTRLIDVEARGEVALLKDNLNQMIHTLALTTLRNQEQDWLKTNLTRFTRMLQGQRDLMTVTERVLSELSTVVDAQHGTFYMAKSDEGGEPYLELFATFAYAERKNLSSRYALGESLVGQAARERKRILMTQVPHDYIRISSSLGEAVPFNIVVMPIVFEGAVKGVIELASFNAFTDIQLAFIDQLIESLGIVIATIEATMRTDGLLRQSQGMAEELQTQQEELQQTNEELEEKARQLTAQRDEVERKNSEVELARRELEDKADQLALTSKYKSQFLANMSHELRTPLNSLLILSRQLSDNRKGNLDDKQVEYASTIHQAGSDLLSLINEILDLAKIESGTMGIDVGEVGFKELEDYLTRSFAHLAETKGLGFAVSLAPDLPESLITDDMRLRQVLRNLLANAIKFTDSGHVEVKVEICRNREWSSHRQKLDRTEQVLAFRVKDTGIGIPKDKQSIVFEAFQQVDGGSNRRHGGTGLGLSISREIAQLLGGDLTLDSEVGKGSTFSLLLPRRLESSAPVSSPPLPATNGSRSVAEPPAFEAALVSRPSLSQAVLGLEGPPVEDDRATVQHGDRVLLVIEDDHIFSELLVEISRERGFKCVVAADGHSALESARQYKPDAISLDLMLPDMDGWVLLDRLKHDPVTRHIPVHIISAAAEERRGREFGALAVLEKPVDRDAIDTTLVELQAFLDKRIKRVLLVEDDETQRSAMLDLIGEGDVETIAVGDAEQALSELANNAYDCMVLDLSLPGMGGLELLQTMKARDLLRRLPVIVYTGMELTKEEQKGLSELAQTVIIKDVRSPERLLEETSLLLHRAEANFPEAKRQMLRSLVHGDPALRHKKVLVVDDDIRNVFALTAVLEQHDIQVINGENGHEALAQLAEHTDVDGVLMDIMMPEMDGYEAMRRIRAMPQYKTLPIIALTAKAMKGDRQKCIEAGASDYVTKPVDTDQLISLLRVWLYR